MRTGAVGEGREWSASPRSPRRTPEIAFGTKLGTVKVCVPEWPVRSDEFEIITLEDGDEIVGCTWLTGGADTLAFVNSDFSLLRYDAKLVRPQGLTGGGINLSGDAQVVSFGAICTDDEYGEPMVVTSSGQSVKVTPVQRVPDQGQRDGRCPLAALPQGRVPPGPRVASSSGRTRVRPSITILVRPEYRFDRDPDGPAQGELLLCRAM